MSCKDTNSLDDLRKRWKYLYQDYLPALALARDGGQKRWPVHLDHCFARVILDNAIGLDKPWTEVVNSPAVTNMTVAQLGAAICLAEKLATGEANLDALDRRSLQLRDKTKKRKSCDPDDGSNTTHSETKKRKKSTPTVSAYFLPRPTAAPTAAAAAAPTNPSSPNPIRSSLSDTTPDLTPQLHLINSSTLTPFRKQTLSLLCQIPAGRYSTYGAMAAWLTQNSHKSCARAVGNAMRNNPFAPGVPCHRVLAGDGSLGGFKGGWGEEGSYASEKRELLRGEGVKFDGRGKVVGVPFREFR